MRKKINLPSYIRNAYFLILSASLLLVAFCGFWGFSLLHSQHRQELSQIGNVAGAVLSEYPEAESLLVSALQDTGYRHADTGFSILGKYGYRNNLLMSDMPYYRFALSFFSSFLAFVLFCCLALTSLFFFHFYRNQKKQEMLLHSLLDRYLSEDASLLEEGLPAGLVFGESFTDTLNKLSKKLTQKTQALAEERDDTKTLVTDISHQLKTPISALKSCFTMCIEADTQKERDDFLTRCSLQMQKMENLVTALVNISRLETSLISLQPESVLLSDLLTDAVNTVYEKALNKNISIEVCLPAQEDSSFDLPDSDEEYHSRVSLFLDRRWTGEALANILENAVKYSPAGSTITLRVRRFYSYVQLEIADQGIGVPKEESNQIFKRFYRGSHPLVKQSEGSGVGLYLTRRIIEEQGGAVSVKPAVRQGSVFTVRLPL